MIEAGHGTIGSVAYEAALGPNTVGGVGNAPPYSYAFQNAFVSAPQVTMLSLAAMDGNDGEWAQTHGLTPATTTTLSLSIDEDQINDSERAHIDEQVGYCVFESPAVYP